MDFLFSIPFCHGLCYTTYDEKIGEFNENNIFRYRWRS